MTTVGYGDKTPITPLGKGLGVITMFIGVLSLAMPVSVVTSNFQEQYYIALARRKALASQPGGGSPGVATPAKDFRDRHLELRQTVMQMHSMLARVQRVAATVDGELSPTLRRLKSDRIEEHRRDVDRKRRATGAAADPRALPAPTRLPPPAPQSTPERLARKAGLVNSQRFSSIEAEVLRHADARAAARPPSPRSPPKQQQQHKDAASRPPAELL